MKIKLLLFLFFGITKLLAQIDNGSVEYAYISNIITDSRNPEFNEQIEKIKASAKTVTFTLNFNKSESYFFINPILGKDSRSMQDICRGGSIVQKFYVNYGSNQHRVYYDDEDFGEFVMEYKQETDWDLINETKMIDGYLCYKAIMSHYNEEGWSGNSNLKTVAWYTPKIPVSFGPDGYGELPGLILELQTPLATLYVKKININLDKEPALKDLKEYRIITYEQQNEKMLLNATPFQKQFLENEFRKSAIIRVEQAAIHKKRKEEKAKLLKQ